MKHKIIITMEDILNAERWEQPIHLAAKRGLPVKYTSVLDVRSIGIAWDRVEYVNMLEERVGGELIIVWKERK